MTLEIVRKTADGKEWAGEVEEGSEINLYGDEVSISILPQNKIEQAKERILERICKAVDGQDANAATNAYMTLINSQHLEAQLQPKVISFMSPEESDKAWANMGYTKI